MKKPIWVFFFLCFISFFLCSCAGKEAAVCPVVTQVDISCQQEDVQIHRHYTNSEKMEYVLLYLRLLGPAGLPQIDPDSIDAEEFVIQVQLLNGQTRYYRQKAHRYFSIDGGPWQSIDPAQAAGLYKLMQFVPSDTL